ncbi:hypothetical protein [Campylobacter sp.]
MRKFAEEFNELSKSQDAANLSALLFVKFDTTAWVNLIGINLV